MKSLVTISVLLVAVGVSLVAVCQHSESCRLRHRLWQVERRRVSLERQRLALDAAIADTLTPKRLLSERGLLPGEGVRPIPFPGPGPGPGPDSDSDSDSDPVPDPAPATDPGALPVRPGALPAAPYAFPRYRPADESGGGR